VNELVAVDAYFSPANPRWERTGSGDPLSGTVSQTRLDNVIMPTQDTLTCGNFLKQRFR
jgi:hypothetical protein